MPNKGLSLRERVARIMWEREEGEFNREFYYKLSGRILSEVRAVVEGKYEAGICGHMIERNQTVTKILEALQ